MNRGTYSHRTRKPDSDSFKKDPICRITPNVLSSGFTLNHPIKLIDSAFETGKRKCFFHTTHISFMEITATKCGDGHQLHYPKEIIQF